MDILSISHLSKSFGPLNVLRDISFSVRKGEVVSIIGPSGSGKSTLLRCATMLETADSGTISYENLRILNNGKYAGKSVLKQARNRFGLVFQSFNLFPHYSVLKNIIDAPVCVQKRNRAEVIGEAKLLLHKIGLEGREDAYPYQLSGGQQQRVAIARSLINNPSILLADEPTGNLDSTTSKEVLHMFKDLNRQQGITVILVTHDPKIAAFTDRAINMADGLICEGISDMLSKDDV